MKKETKPIKISDNKDETEVMDLLDDLEEINSEGDQNAIASIGCITVCGTSAN